ncbi:hypothetical protein HJFPF1_07175 [Paramyrothecium foliicola]|nr:hypothetical protein HJFPF1_07175 [Paramyrothecium foliicola]
MEEDAPDTCIMDLVFLRRMVQAEKAGEALLDLIDDEKILDEILLMLVAECNFPLPTPSFLMLRTPTNGSNRRATSQLQAHWGSARRIAQAIGETDELCRDGSSFREAYAGCAACVQREGRSNSSAIGETYSQLAEFLAHCDLSPFLTTAIVTLTHNQPQVITYTARPTLRTDDDSDGGGQSIGDGGPPPWISECFYHRQISTSLSPFCLDFFDLDRTSSATPASTTIQSSSIGTGTASPPQTTFFTSPITTSFRGEAPTPSAGLTAADNDNAGGNAWIAGPAVGSLAGLALVFGGVFLLYRRRRRVRRAHAAELGSEERAIKDRLETAYEIEGSLPVELVAEKPANEAPAKELVS